MWNRPTSNVTVWNVDRITRYGPDLSAINFTDESSAKVVLYFQSLAVCYLSRYTVSFISNVLVLLTLPSKYLSSKSWASLIFRFELESSSPRRPEIFFYDWNGDEMANVPSDVTDPASKNCSGSLWLSTKLNGNSLFVRCISVLYIQVTIWTNISHSCNWSSICWRSRVTCVRLCCST